MLSARYTNACRSKLTKTVSMELDFRGHLSLEQIYNIYFYLGKIGAAFLTVTVKLSTFGRRTQALFNFDNHMTIEDHSKRRDKKELLTKN